MIMRPQISVIVPVYNVERYIKRCIDSILSQTFHDFELLLIDDGSEDESGKICDEYAQKEAFIRVFHKANEGISATREFGIQHALGTYIQFVDSDDWIDRDMLEMMYNKVLSSNADLVGCNFIQEDIGKSIKQNVIYADTDNFLRSVITNQWGVLWKLLIKRSLFSKYDIHFPLGVNGGEDYFIVVSLLLIENLSVSFVNSYLYHYVQTNSNSFMSTPSLAKLMYQVEATTLVEQVLKKKGKLLDYNDELMHRKVVTKLAVMYFSFFNGLKLYPEISFSNISKVKSLKDKLLLCFSVIYNKLRLCK